MNKRFIAVLLILLGVALAYVDFVHLVKPEWVLGQINYRLGLDLQGGTHLVYVADVSGIPAGEAEEAVAGLRDVIERRVNFFGVAEPVVQVERSGDELRLIVELAGVFDVNEAIQYIGETPYLEFRTERPEEEINEILEAQKNGERMFDDPYYAETKLTGRYLKNSSVSFDNVTGSPLVLLSFNDEGSEIFASLTRDYIDKRIAIYLDGSPISQPVVQNEITGGQAQISGDFSVQEAKELVRNLNSGALPVPISIISQQSIGPTLGARAFEKGIMASIYSILAVSLFLILWYRLPGVVGVLALTFYILFVLSIFKIFGLTLTAAGIAGFILSIGMAVDANILIFERIKEEITRGQSIDNALKDGFWRAWPSIRDANISTIITSTILFWFGTSMVKGFALTLGIGVISSLLSAFIITRTFIMAIGLRRVNIRGFLYGSGFSHLKLEELGQDKI